MPVAWCPVRQIHLVPEEFPLTAVAENLGRDARIVGLISLGHLLSHVYMLALPPLFPVLRQELGLSYVELGIAMTVFAVATASLQTPMGFLCERFGSRLILIAGLIVNAVAVGLMGFADSLLGLSLLMAMAGVGSSVFHPADYSILSGTVAESRLGRAFAIHTFGGAAGFALAPVIMVGLTAAFDWRTALMIVGCVGVVVALLILASSGVITEGEGKKKPGGGISLRELLTSRPILMFFLFYAGSAAANVGINQFAVAAMTEIYAVPLALANSVLTIYLVAVMVGVLPGGWAADKTSNHTTLIVGGFAVCVILVALVGVEGVGFWLALALLTVVGAIRGFVQSSRDVLVRAIAPKASVGTVFGFVSTGFLAGQALAPPIYGVLLDLGSPSVVFWLSAAFSLLCLLTALPGAGGRAQRQS
jgi:FSR family fosmidomycin resistance protein-like MFS transporter